MKDEQTYISLYNEFSSLINSNSAEVLNRDRDSAFQKFKELGFPSGKDENYKYSTIVKTLSADYGVNLNRLMFFVDKSHLYHCKIPSINATMAFMVNDSFYIPDDQKNELAKQVVFCSLSEAEKLYPQIVDRYIGKQSNKSNDNFTSFNRTFAQNGFFLYVPKNTKVSEPLQLINILRSESPLMTFSHNLIVVESGAELQLLNCDHSADDVEFFKSGVTEIFVEENARFDFYIIENTNRKTNKVSQMFINQKDSSNVVISSLGLINNKTFNRIEADIDGQNANLFLGGMLISDGKQETENFAIIRHNRPNSSSKELYKYILDEEARGIFSGKILVDNLAQKTNSSQTNKNICLSSDAVVKSRPQLEIYADDVKCGHGTTTGQLDKTAMFYMMSRGIDQQTARMMLLSAFVQDVIDNVKLEVLKDRLKMMIDRRLKKENSHCANCFIC